MLADIFTKPLQGALFRKMRDAIMNIQAVSHDSSVLPSQNHRSVLKNKTKYGENVRRNTSHFRVNFVNTDEVRYFDAKHSASTGTLLNEEKENGWT